MSRPVWIFASLLTAFLALVGVPHHGSAATGLTGDAFVGMTYSRTIAGEHYFAVTSNGTVYSSAVSNSTGEPQSFRAVGSVPPGVVNIITGHAPWIFIGNANGDLYAANVNDPPPWNFTLARIGAPGLAPENSARSSRISERSVWVWAARTDTDIPYTTAAAGRVSVRVYDAAQRLVRTIESEHSAAGQYSTRWDGLTDRGERAANGVYYYRVGFPDGTQASGSLIRVK
ncbi:MAG TPA: FlgD immunoglobulin-like domain containing protein [Vicinamibacteria bacterium]